MTGPEHYRVAEELLAETKARSLERSVQALAQAQVHATLALTAATMDVAGATVNGVVTTGWSEAIA